MTRPLPDIAGVIAIHHAQNQYHQRFGRYSDNLADLGLESGWLIPNGLTAAEDAGCEFTLRLTPSGYEIHVQPKGSRNLFERTLFSDQTQVIRTSAGREPANARSKAIQ
jgi:hypothetical protein